MASSRSLKEGGCMKQKYENVPYPYIHIFTGRIGAVDDLHVGNIDFLPPP
jgi:hypothetical protein